MTVAGRQSPMFSFRDDTTLRATMRTFYESNRVLAAYCHGTSANVEKYSGRGVARAIIAAGSPFGRRGLSRSGKVPINLFNELWNGGGTQVSGRVRCRIRRSSKASPEVSSGTISQTGAAPIQVTCTGNSRRSARTDSSGSGVTRTMVVPRGVGIGRSKAAVMEKLGSSAVVRPESAPEPLRNVCANARRSRSGSLTVHARRENG